MSKLQCVVVGTGGWAETHLRAYQLCTQVEPVALVGHANAERLEALAGRYGITYRSLSLAEALAATQAEMVDIACNPHYRLEGVRAAEELAEWVGTNEYEVLTNINARVPRVYVTE